MERLCGSDVLIKFQATSVTQASPGRDVINRSALVITDKVEARSAGVSGWEGCCGEPDGRSLRASCAWTRGSWLQVSVA